MTEPELNRQARECLRLLQGKHGDDAVHIILGFAAIIYRNGWNDALGEIRLAVDDLTQYRAVEMVRAHKVPA